mgnify:FL=1
MNKEWELWVKEKKYEVEDNKPVLFNKELKALEEEVKEEELISDLPP